MNTTNTSFFKILTAICLGLGLFTLTSCNQEITSKQLEELKESYTELSSKITDKITKEYEAGEQQLSDLTDSEIKKLRTIEYKVVDLNTELANQDVEQQLAKLGEERWDCFHLERHNDQLKTYCKRLPSSHLRTLARISKIVP